MITIKVKEFNKEKLLKRIGEQVDELLGTISTKVYDNYKEEVPVDTGNLKQSTVKSPIFKNGGTKTIIVGTDTEKAPYVRYVYFPAGLHGMPVKTNRSRRYAGNDWIARTVSKTMIEIPKITTDTFNKLNGIEI